LSGSTAGPSAAHTVSHLNLGKEVSQFWFSLCWHFEVKVCLQLIHQDCSCVLLHKSCNPLQPVFLNTAAAAVYILQIGQMGFFTPKTLHALHVTAYYKDHVS